MNTNQERQRLVIGNWKMNGNLADNARLLGSVRESVAGAGACAVAVCVPFPYLSQAQAALSGSAVSWGAQDVSVHGSGAYTGEVSAAMLNDFACRWVLVGHSERRTYHAETNELVAQKAQVALNAGLTPVVCVGETLQQQEAGETAQVIASQLAPVLALGAQAVAKMVIAYEPVWAIGTGRTATPQQAQDVHALIRQSLSELGVAQVQVLYGGSVKGANAASLFAMPDIDGALVGGAALVAEEFLSIAAA
ncbi:triose-phosphate isomerase [Pusillimonas minor]|uniref:Triosephosphate isomerase n=1 Tax=Pusillimonas minor TaxID=2697024 RepID=A0A842HN55_9BURK|nr:triose-phosphate isomerase [Pusillimonas minor]MBC2768740.1 triose-phosphate isomerase [Pusillimonas minor]